EEGRRSAGRSTETQKLEGRSRKPSRILFFTSACQRFSISAFARLGTRANNGPKPSIIVGCVNTASRNRVYGCCASIATWTLLINSPASGPKSGEPENAIAVRIDDDLPEPSSLRKDAQTFIRV